MCEQLFYREKEKGQYEFYLLVRSCMEIKSSEKGLATGWEHGQTSNLIHFNRQIEMSIIYFFYSIYLLRLNSLFSMSPADVPHTFIPIQPQHLEF